MCQLLDAPQAPRVHTFETLCQRRPGAQADPGRVSQGGGRCRGSIRWPEGEASGLSPHFYCSLVEGGEAGRITLQSPVFLAVYIKPDQASKVVPGDGSEQS
jgi:hypothetical protein